jgi:hypothetical protein
MSRSVEGRGIEIELEDAQRKTFKEIRTITDKSGRCMALLREDASSRMTVRCQGSTEHPGTLTYTVFGISLLSEMGTAIMASCRLKDVSPGGMHDVANCSILMIGSDNPWIERGGGGD